MGRGVILLSHGSRQEAANEDFRNFVRTMQGEDPGEVYVAAFLSSGHPGLETAALELLNRGCDRIVVMPVFLGAGSHVLEDIPRIISQLARDHQGLEIVQAPHVGSHPGLALLVREQIESAGAAFNGGGA